MNWMEKVLRCRADMFVERYVGVPCETLILVPVTSVIPITWANEDYFQDAYHECAYTQRKCLLHSANTGYTVPLKPELSLENSIQVIRIMQKYEICRIFDPCWIEADQVHSILWSLQETSKRLLSMRL